MWMGWAARPALSKQSESPTDCALWADLCRGSARLRLGEAGVRQCVFCFRVHQMNPSAPIRRQKVPVLTPARGVRELLSPRGGLIAALALAVAVFAVYWLSLDFQFILDDHRFTNDPRIQSSGHVWDYFANYVWAQFTGGPSSFYRPVFIVWMRVNFILSGTSPWGWHLLSIAKHAAAGLLLGLLAWRLLRDRAAALLAATLFGLHPAQTESVAWVTVPDPLMSIGILGAVLFYLRYAEGSHGDVQGQGKKSRKARTERTKTRGRWLVAAVVAGLAALLAKETAIVLPGMIFALALILPPEPAQPNAAENSGLGTPMGHALRQSLPFVGVTALSLALRFHALGGKLGTLTQHLPWSTVVLSWPATLWFYVKVLLWPVRSRAFADPELADTFSGLGVVLPGLAVAGTVAMLAVALRWAWRKSGRDLSEDEASGIKGALVIGTLLLVVPVFLALNLNALNPGDFLHGRYTYLASAGLMLLVATGWHLAGKWRIPLLCAAGVVAVAFGGLTVSQERMWKDDLTVFTVAHQLAPHNAPVAQNLANAHVQGALRLDEEGRCEEAMPVFEQVAQEYPQDWYAWAGLGDCYVQLSNLPKAEESLRRAAELSHEPRVIQQWQELRAHMGLPSPGPGSTPNSVPPQ
jgi:protein O-mannosyl-transferase